MADTYVTCTHNVYQLERDYTVSMEAPFVVLSKQAGKQGAAVKRNLYNFLGANEGTKNTMTFFNIQKPRSHQNRRQPRKGHHRHTHARTYAGTRMRSSFAVIIPDI